MGVFILLLETDVELIPTSSQGGVIDENEDAVTEKLNAAIKATVGKFSTDFGRYLSRCSFRRI